MVFFCIAKVDIKWWQFATIFMPLPLVWGIKFYTFPSVHMSRIWLPLFTLSKLRGIWNLYSLADPVAFQCTTFSVLEICPLICPKKIKKNYFLRFLLNNVSSGHAFVPFSNFSFQWRNVLRFLHNVFFSYSNTMYIFLLFQIYAPL